MQNTWHWGCVASLRVSVLAPSGMLSVDAAREWGAGQPRLVRAVRERTAQRILASTVSVPLSSCSYRRARQNGSLLP
jgi:hypothetical protein